MIEVKNLIRTFSDAPGHVVQALAVKEFTLGKGEKNGAYRPVREWKNDVSPLPFRSFVAYIGDNLR